MAVFVLQQQLLGARGGETSTSKSSASSSPPTSRRASSVPSCSAAARRCSRSRLAVLALSSPAPRGLSAATESASETAIATSAAAATRVVVETPLPLAIVVEPPTSGSGGDGGGLPPRDNEGGPGDGDGGGDGRRKFFRFNVLAGLVAGVKARAAADPEFATKLLIECGLDLSIILGVNAASRGARFFSEVEFVASQAAVSLLNDFALVYLLAPTGLPAPSAAARGSLAAALASLPSHAFQAGSFPLRARLACLGARAAQYGAVGLLMGCAGSALVRALVAAREAADASYRPPQTEQRVLDTGLAWCYFMAVSSNLRYNAVNGVEDWAYGRARRGAVAAAAAATGGGAAAPLLLASPAAARSVSVALRLSNNVFGAHSFIQLAKFLNLDRPREVGGRKKKEKEKQGSKEASKDGVWWRPRSAVVA